MTTTPYNQKLRYRLGRWLSALPTPTVEDVPVSDDVQLLVTPSIEYIFSRPAVLAEVLLKVGRTYFVSDSQTRFSTGPINHAGFELLQGPKVSGKHYRFDEQSHQESPADEVDFDAGKSEGIGESPTGRRPQKDISKRGSLRTPDFWDLLLPLLQPPVEQAFVDLLDLPPRCFPYPYQWEGIKFLVERKSALLADDMGTGKTVQGILACRLLFQHGVIARAVVVSPLTALPQWEKEFERWAPVLTTVRVRGSMEQRQALWQTPAHVWLTTYETLRQDIESLTGNNLNVFDLVVIDEAQRIKNRFAGVSDAVRRLERKYSWALTGTPIENRIDELVAIFAFLCPGLFGKGEVSPGFAKDLIAPYFLRRRKEDVLKDLPPKEEYPLCWVRLTEKQQETYDRMEREQVVELQNQGTCITAHNILTLIARLKQICNRDPVSGESAKLDWLLETLPDIFESGDKVLIFTQYRDEKIGGTEWLEKELAEFRPLNYSNADTDRKKQEMLEAFQTNSAHKIFLGNPRTAGVALNQLVVANYVVHFDHWWNPAVTNQATARAHRPNQEKEVFVYHLWTQGTVEERVLRVTADKQRLFEEVIDSLSSGISEDMLLDIYDDLLVKHGFKPLQPVGKRMESKTGESQSSALEKVRTPRDFEMLVGRLFAALGFSTRVTQYSKDGGVDVIASREVGASIEKNAIQCKYQASPVGRVVFQQLLGVLAADPTFTKGVLVTNADVTRDAYELVRGNGRLQVISGRELEGLLRKYGIQ